MPQFLNSSDPDFADAFERFLNLKRDVEVDVDAVVAGIISDVRARGIDAVLELTSKFDRLDLSPETVAFSSGEIDAAIATVPEAERSALEQAAQRIRAYHERQLPRNESWTDSCGRNAWLALDAGRCRRSLCSRRACKLPVFGPDERDPGQGRGCRASCDLRTDPGRPGEPACASCSSDFGGRDGLSHRRCPGDRPRWRTAPIRSGRSTRSPVPVMRMLPPRNAGYSAMWVST